MLLTTQFWSSYWIQISIMSVLLVFSLFSNANATTMSTELKELLGIRVDVEPDFVRIASSPNQNYTEDTISVNAPDILSLDVSQVGAGQLLFRVVFAHSVNFNDGSLIHFYLDMDNNEETGRSGTPTMQGVDILVTVRDGSVSITSFNSDYPRDMVFAQFITREDILYLSLEGPLRGDEEFIYVDARLLAERWKEGGKIGRSDSTPRQSVKLRRQFSDYRYIDTEVKYESLDNKGMSFASVAPDEPLIFGRERPSVTYVYNTSHPGKEGRIARRQIPVQVLEEAGVEREEASVRFGFPFPAGAVFDLERIRLLASEGEEVSAQFTATAFWPDGSLKWILIDFKDRLGSKEERTYWVEFGNDVKRSIEGSEDELIVSESDEAIVVTTGPLRVSIRKDSFNLFESVWLNVGENLSHEYKEVAASGPEGIGLVDEHGTLFGTSLLPPESIRIEEMGSEKVVVRAEGQYASETGEQYMRYITRLAFQAGSTRVNITHTHLNDYLNTEFTDFTSLYIPIVTSAPIARAEVFTKETGTGLAQQLRSFLNTDGGQRDSGFTTHADTELRLFQSDEKTTKVNGATVASTSYYTPGISPGVIRVLTDSSTISAVIHDFQERWPKGLVADSTGFSLELLPELPDSEYGTDLPNHLMFPFVSGKHRLKWGMSFTERITIDFGGKSSVEELAADGRLPVIAVIPAEWYSETRVFGPIAVSSDERMDAWDRFVSQSYLLHSGRTKTTREFGHLNYGDWFGERGRNWGNNEYDRAHGFFMEFVRTGDRRYFRLALSAARHQADVDIVHAFPDPAFVGGNVPHSVAHTGTTPQDLLHGTWSWRYDRQVLARNGHTWVDGMMDAWYLSGDARVMEAAFALGESIVWSMAPQFQTVGTAQRSPGWALRAIMALYRGTYDPLYLEAAHHIANITLSEQDLEQSGVWPHRLPLGHTREQPGAAGNNLFNIGVLLAGLKSYYEETQDPRALKSIEAGVNWVVKSWDEQQRGWPYSASPEGEPLYQAATPSLNALIAPAIAYVGALREDEHLLGIAQTAMEAYAKDGPKDDGKSIAMALYFSSEIFGWLEEGYTSTDCICKR